MTIRVPSANITVGGAAAAITLATSEDLYVGRGIQIAATDATAVMSSTSGGDNNIAIDGTVAGNVGVGLGLNSTVIVGVTGVISAQQLGIYGFVGTTNGYILNEGLVFSSGLGITDRVMQNLTIVNEGQIRSGFGDFLGLNGPIYFEWSGTKTIENSGTIEPLKSGAIGIKSTSSAAIELITNSGTIKGGISLGGGDDRYDGAAGHVTGNVLGGDGADQLTGGIDGDTLLGEGGADTLRGNGGNDWLDGGAAADVMFGGVGTDSYVVDDPLDTVNETGGSGTDTVVTGLSFNLGNAARAIGAVEHLTLTGTNAVNATGNSLANLIIGNAAANILNGGPGDDNLVGANGNDRLIGGTGNDRMTGGANNDHFVFNTAPNAATNRDTIVDFVHGVDKFDLENAVFSKLGAAGGLNAAFFRAGTAAADANDHVIYNKATGALFYDANANAAGGAVQFATLLNKPTLTAADFVVI